MAYGFLDIAVDAQRQAPRRPRTAARICGRISRATATFDRFTENEAAFIAERDSFYMATVSETGWPYVQHRGGPRGFLRVLDDRTLAFADYRGNRQYISLGNLGADDRVSLILMDYANRRAPEDLRAMPRSTSLADDPGACGAGYDARLSRQARTRLRAASRGVRLELPAAHHAALQRSRTWRGDRRAAGSGSRRWRRRTRRCRKRQLAESPSSGRLASATFSPQAGREKRLTYESRACRPPARLPSPLPARSDARGRCGRCLPPSAPNSIATAASRDHVAGVGADDVHAEHAVGLGVGEDLHEAVGLLIGLGAAIGGERKFADIVGDAGGLQFFLGFCRPRRFPDRCRPRSGSRRNSHDRPGRRGFRRRRRPRPRPCAPASARAITSPMA